MKHPETKGLSVLIGEIGGDLGIFHLGQKDVVKVMLSLGEVVMKW